MKKAIIICCTAIMALSFFSCPEAPSAQAASITLDRTEAVLGLEMDLQLHAEIVNGPADDESLTWISSDATVAEITESGLISTKQPGTATITVSLESDNAVKAQCLVTVENGYMVSFDSNGGSSFESLILSSGSLITTPDPEPTKLGYVFHSWYKDADLIAAWNFAGDHVLAPTTLYARWTAITYTITYNLNGGAFMVPSVPYSYTIENHIPLLSVGKPDCYFAGWFDNANFSGDPISEIPVGSVGDRAFYVKWLAARTVTFRSNNPANQSQSFTDAETRTFALKSNMFDYSGYKFLGWSRTAAAATPEFVLPASIILGATNETFYAIWACEYLFTIANNEASITGLSGAWTPGPLLNIPSTLGGKSVTSIGTSAFSGNTHIVSVSIPGSVRILGEWCFADCANLETVYTNTGLVELRNFTFENCVRLSSFSFPSIMTAFTFYTFMGCTGLSTFSIAPGNSSFALDSGVLYNTSKTDLYLYPAAKNGTTFTVPSTVTRIATLAFGKCQNLTKIIVPASVNDIGRKAFWSSAKVTNIRFLGTTPAVLMSDDAFDDNPAELWIYVPQAAVNAYKTATYWSEYADRMVMVL